MKRLKFIVAWVCVTVLAMSIGSTAFAAEAVTPPEIARTVLSEKYTEAQLFDMVLAGKIEQDQFTQVEVARTVNLYGDSIVTIELNELRQRTYSEKTPVESYKKLIISAVVPAASDSDMQRAIGSSSQTQWYSTYFALTLTLTYDKGTSGDAPTYKVTDYSSSYAYHGGHYEFRRLDLNVGAQGKAFSSTSSSSLVGTRTESSSKTVNLPAKDTPYSQSTGFQYYTEAVSLTNVGGHADLIYTFSNFPDLRTLSVNIQLI